MQSSINQCHIIIIYHAKHDQKWFCSNWITHNMTMIRKYLVNSEGFSKNIWNAPSVILTNIYLKVIVHKKVHRLTKMHQFITPPLFNRLPEINTSKNITLIPQAWNICSHIYLQHFQWKVTSKFKIIIWLQFCR